MSDAAMPKSPSAPGNWPGIARRIRVPLGFLFAVVYIWMARPTTLSLTIGALTIVPGLALRALASGHVQKDKQLTVSGPYAYTRNPLYLGSLIMAAGFAVAARSWWVVAIMLLMFAAIYVPVIAGEERFLRQSFAGYGDYARQVPRLFPRLTRYGAESAAYSADRFWKHREYQASLGCLAMLAMLVIKRVLLP